MRLASRTGVHLLKLLKDSLVVRWANSNSGIYHAYAEHAPARARGTFLFRRGTCANDDAAAVGILDCVSDQVHENLPEVKGVRSYFRHRSGYIDGQAESAVAGEWFDLARYIEQKWSNVDRLGVNLETPGSHFCEIQNLINEMPQVRGRSFDSLDRFHLARAELSVHAIPQQINKPDNRVERSAKLVRDVCEKFAFHPIDVQQLCGKPLELGRSVGKPARMVSFAAEHKRQCENRGDGQQPADDTGQCRYVELPPRAH